MNRKPLIFWFNLTSPHESIQEIGSQREARLFLAFLLFSLIFLCLGIILTALFAPAITPLLTGLLALLSLIYRVARTSYYSLATKLSVGLLCLTPFVQSFLSINDTPFSLTSRFAWLLAGVILASIYLSARQMILLIVLNSGGLLLLPVLVPTIEWFVIGNILVSSVIISLLITLVVYYRRLVAQDRITELQKRQVELAKVNQALQQRTQELEQALTKRQEAEKAVVAANNELMQARDELEIRVVERTSELAELNKDMKTLLYVISHDLKEPLRAIENFSRMVNRRYAKQLDHKGQDFLRRVIRAAERMRCLLDDILTLSRVQQMNTPTELITGNTIINRVLERLETRIQESNATVRVASDLPALQVDRTWATEALYNLVSNALKYTQDGEAPIIDIEAYHEADKVGFVIKDRGPGVRAEHAEKIFQMFQRAVGREIEGTGAGLAIVRQIAERHRGRAWVEAREGGGSAFIITFASSS